MLTADDVRLMTVPSQGGNDAKAAGLVQAARAGAGTALSAAERARLRASLATSLASPSMLHTVPFQIDSAIAYVAPGKTMLLLVCMLCGYGTLMLVGVDGQAAITARLDMRGIVPQAR